MTSTATIPANGRHHGANGFPNETYAMARRFADAGICFIPTGKNKLPAGWLLPRNPDDPEHGEWKSFESRRPTQEEIDQWFGDSPPKAGIACVHGKISGNLETLDFDHQADTIFPEWRKLADAQAPGLVDRLTIIRTPADGFHVRWRCTESVEGNKKLAQVVVTDGAGKEKTEVKIETRGEGGYAVCPGTLPKFHPIGKPYVHLAGPNPWEPPTITPDERAILLNAARLFDETPYEPAAERTAGDSKYEVTPWDDFNQRGDGWQKILTDHNWTLHHEAGGVQYWKHPTANGEWSATVNHAGNDLLHVFSTNAGLPAGKSYSRYAAVVFLDYRGDFKQAAIEFEKRGFGKLKPTTKQTTGNNGPAAWGDPKPLPSGIPAVLPFDPKLLPWPFEAWLTDVSERTQAPIDFSAAAAMCALSSIVGGKIGIRPKSYDDWTVIPNLWGMAVGRPGVMKSQAIEEAFRPLKRLEAQAAEKYQNELKEFNSLEMVAEARKAQAKKAVEKAVKSGDPLLARELAEESINSELSPPSRRRYEVSDTTLEKLGEICSHNPQGVAMVRDELIGMFKQLEKEGNEGLRAFLMQAWNGNGSYTFDRIGRGTVYCDPITISIFGGIQPGPLGDYQRAAARNGAEADGLLQRFQLAVYPDISTEWRNVDRWPDSQAKNTAHSVFVAIDEWTPADFGAQIDEGDAKAVPFLRLSPDAQEVFISWRIEQEPRLRSDAEHPAIASHLGKYRSLVPSLALLIHLAEGTGGPVGIEPLKKALGWARYLESHARRIFAVSVGDDAEGAKSLSEMIIKGALKDGFALREVYRHEWSGLATKEDAERAVGILCDLDWIRESAGSTFKRQRWDINPRALRK